MDGASDDEDHQKQQHRGEYNPEDEEDVRTAAHDDDMDRNNKDVGPDPGTEEPPTKKAKKSKKKTRLKSLSNSMKQYPIPFRRIFDQRKVKWRQMRVNQNHLNQNT